MYHGRHKALYRKLSARGFHPKHVAEVGVYHPETSNVYDYVMQGVRCTLVEPDPDCVRRIRKHFSAQCHVTVHPVAVYDFHGQVELVRRAASTFVAHLPSSPAIVNDRYRLDANDTFVVEARTFDEIDDGTIDLLSVDVEGSEWYVIKHMTSRPTVISLETHGAAYRNPHLEELSRWMEANSYVLLYKDKTDSVFVKQGALEVNAWDRARQRLMNAYLGCRRMKRRIKHIFTSS